MKPTGIVLVVLLSATLAAAQCELIAGCDNCVSNQASGCGWCADDQRCRSGGSQGPKTGKCGAWYWEVCPGCGSQSYCNSCLNGQGCGWCVKPDAVAQCMEGNATGPYVDPSACASWSYSSQGTCPTLPPPTPAPLSLCSQYSGAGNCFSCVDTQGCGWCASTQECFPGDYRGPSEGKCDAWYMECPNCGGYYNCQGCLAKHHCGWCPTSAGNVYCFNGNASGPYRGACDSWVYGQSVCPTLVPPSVAPSGVCTQYTNCASCQDQYGCGWCGVTRQCLPGFQAPTPASACPTQYWYSSSTAACPNCESLYDCEACRVQAGCGWCSVALENGEYCAFGNVSGPFGETCSGHWSQYPETCPTPEPPTVAPPGVCDQYLQCDTCVEDIGCGWCEASQSCQSGGSGGPAIGTCTGGWAYESCPGCSSISDCSDCTATENGMCGWCSSTNTCQAGNSNGPFNNQSQCSNWTAPGGSCFYDPCAQWTRCTACISTPQQTCGWCMDSGTCRSGSTSGPDSGYCGSWYYVACPTGFCNAQSTCASCVAAPAGDCGWCTSTKVCSSGTSSGPNTGTCSGSWEWTPSQCIDSSLRHEKSRLPHP